MNVIYCELLQKRQRDMHLNKKSLHSFIHSFDLASKYVFAENVEWLNWVIHLNSIGTSTAHIFYHTGKVFTQQKCWNCWIKSCVYVLKCFANKKFYWYHHEKKKKFEKKKLRISSIYILYIVHICRCKWSDQWNSWIVTFCCAVYRNRQRYWWYG